MSIIDHIPVTRIRARSHSRRGERKQQQQQKKKLTIVSFVKTVQKDPQDSCRSREKKRKGDGDKINRGDREGAEGLKKRCQNCAARDRDVLSNFVILKKRRRENRCSKKRQKKKFSGGDGAFFFLLLLEKRARGPTRQTDRLHWRQLTIWLARRRGELSPAEWC
jgi:hypothetical protein